MPAVVSRRDWRGPDLKRNLRSGVRSLCGDEMRVRVGELDVSIFCVPRPCEEVEGGDDDGPDAEY